MTSGEILSIRAMRYMTSERSSGGQIVHDPGGVLGFLGGEDQGHGLRMFALQQPGHHARLHPGDGFQRAVSGSGTDLLQKRFCPARVAAAGDGLADEFLPLDEDSGLLDLELSNSSMTSWAILAGTWSMFIIQRLIVRTSMSLRSLNTLDGRLLAEAEQKNGGFFGAGKFAGLHGLAHGVSFPSTSCG